MNAPSPERQSGVVQMLVGVKPRKHVPVPTYLVEMCHERHCGFLEINHAGTEKREDRGKSCAAYKVVFIEIFIMSPSCFLVL